MSNTGYSIITPEGRRHLHCSFSNQPGAVGWFVHFKNGKDFGICLYNNAAEVDSAINEVFGTIREYGLMYQPFYDERDNPRFERENQNGQKGFTKAV